jgi:hypothetical protein
LRRGRSHAAALTRLDSIRAQRRAQAEKRKAARKIKKTQRKKFTRLDVGIDKATAKLRKKLGIYRAR